MNLDKFECQRCNACCKQPGFVYLKPEEVEPLARFLNLELYAFTDHYCDVIDKRHLVLKKHPDERCIFLTEEGCSVHAVKPGQCRDFPVQWRTLKSLDYCEGLKRL